MLMDSVSPVRPSVNVVAHLLIGTREDEIGKYSVECNLVRGIVLRIVEKESKTEVLFEDL